MILSKATYSNSYIHALMAMQGADTYVSLGFSILPKGTLTCRPGELKPATFQ